MTKKSSQPKSPGGRQTYTSTTSQPFLSETILSAFSQDGKFFALVTLAVDKHRLRIFNGISGSATAEYTISSGRVTSLIWSIFALDAGEQQVSPSKKRKKRRVEDEEGKDSGSPGIAIVALGLSDGSILLFSPSHSKVIRTLSHGTGASAIIALTPSLSESHLWSSSADSSIHLWDVQRAVILKNWKNDDRIPYTSLAPEPRSVNENETNLLVAHHHIRLLTELSLSSSNKPKQLASFTGHASPIKILRWIQSTGMMRQFCSVAEGDRYIYLWGAQGASTNEKPIASILLDSDVRILGFDSGGPSKTTLIGLSSSGCLSFIPIPADLPSQRSENINIHTLLPQSTLQNGRKGKSNPIILDFTCIPSSIGTVRVVRLVNGIKPVFDVVRYLDDNGEYEQNLGLEGIRDAIVDDGLQVIPSKRYREPSAIGLGSGLDPDQASEMRDSTTQREIDGSLEANLPELSLGQRLGAVAENDVDVASGSDSNESEDTNPKKSKRKAAKTNISLVPSNSLTRTLTQALHSSDSRLLEMCLAHTDPKLIRNTIRRLPPQLAIPLIDACVERLRRGARGANMKGRGGGASSQRGMGLITWINTVLAVHAGHLMTVPDIVARLSGLYTTLNERLSLHESLVSLSGRLDTVLTVVESRAAVAPASLTVDKAAKEKKLVTVERYVEGESESEEAEDMEVERFEDAGSVEDIELGRESDSESEAEEESMNEFIDDQAEEDEDEDTNEEDDSEY